MTDGSGAGPAAPPRLPAPRAKVAAGELVDVAMTVNGGDVTVTVPPRVHLADALREQLGLTGTHLGCEHGVCGMCTVLVDGEAARACLVFAVQCEGAQIVTVEGLGGPDDQHPLQRAFSAHHGLQCGFCTPGMLLSGYDLLANGHDGTRIPPETLPAQMSGVLCRCTGYRGILAAVADVAAAHPEGIPPPRGCAPRTLVGRRGTPVPAREPDAAVPTPPPEHVELPSGAPSAVVEVTHTLSSPVDRVWAVLDDFDLLAHCLPGARLIEVLDGDRYRGRATVALGPVRLSFDGLAEVAERDPERHRMRVLAQGSDTGGSATRADIRLDAEPEAGGGTTLRAHADVHLSGRVAQFGRALADDVGRRLFEQFAVAVDTAAATGTAPAAGPGPLRIAVAAGWDALRAGLRRVASRAWRRIRGQRRPFG